jgi:ribosomal protein S17E
MNIFIRSLEASVGRVRKIDCKALAKKLIEKQLVMFEKDPDHKMAPSELSWLLDVFKTMADQESKVIANPLEDLDEDDLLSIVNGGK